MEPIGNIQIDTCYKTGLEVEQDSPLRCSSHALLDSEGCISLGKILATYDAPINEEHAWALCYLSVKCLETYLLSSDTTPGRENIILFKQTSNCSSELIKICPQNGHVVLNVKRTVDVTNPTEFEEDDRNGKCLTKSKLISKIAMAVYTALDFGMREDEERSLSFKLEDVLVQMSSPSEEDKEILYEPSHCFQNQDQFNEQDILNSCLDQFESTAAFLQGGCSADAYYQQICKNLAFDALEFWKFLRVAEQASQKLRYLCGISDHLPRQTLSEKPAPADIRDNLKVVAKHWMQVVREIKQGVTLKQREDVAVDDEHHEYMKSPYELLMEDIKSRKYKLREVAEESQAREEKKALDLHDIIMKHIRSCPKLQNVSSRVLKPVVLAQKPDLHEELMRSIRQVHHLRAVKSTGSL